MSASCKRSLKRFNWKMLPNIQNNNIKHIFPGKPRSWAQRITEESGRPDVGESVICKYMADISLGALGAQGALACSKMDSL